MTTNYSEWDSVYGEGLPPEPEPEEEVAEVIDAELPAGEDLPTSEEDPPQKGGLRKLIADARDTPEQAARKQEARAAGTRNVIQALRPLKRARIKPGPSEESIRKLVEGRRPSRPEGVERDPLEESLDFDPGAAFHVTTGDLLGIGTLSDPFHGIELFGPLSPPRIAESVELNMALPGGLKVTHLIKDSTGALGYRLDWQGQSIDWFPPER